MAQLSESDHAFLSQRRARKNAGLLMVPGAMVALIGVWVALYLWWPMAVNPKAIWGAQEREELVCGTGNLSTYAVSAAMLVNVAFALLCVMLILRIAWSRSERRYLRLLDKALELPAGIAAPALPSPRDGQLRQ